MVSRSKSNYKQNLCERRESQRELLSAVSPSLANKLQRYYDCLNGDQTYVDNHTGKEVHARTYKKRVALAAAELERIEVEVNLSLRYGRMNDFNAARLVDYAHSLYEVAIKKNEYLKRTNTNRTKLTKRLRSSLNSLNEKVISGPLQKMNVQTNYGQFDKPQVPVEDIIDTTLPRPLERELIIKCKRKSRISTRFYNFLLGAGTTAILTGLFIAAAVYSKREPVYEPPSNNQPIERVNLDNTNHIERRLSLSGVRFNDGSIGRTVNDE